MVELNFTIPAGVSERDPASRFVSSQEATRGSNCRKDLRNRRRLRQVITELEFRTEQYITISSEHMPSDRSADLGFVKRRTVRISLHFLFLIMVNPFLICGLPSPFRTSSVCTPFIVVCKTSSVVERFGKKCRRPNPTIPELKVLEMSYHRIYRGSKLSGVLRAKHLQIILVYHPGSFGLQCGVLFDPPHRKPVVNPVHHVVSISNLVHHLTYF